MVLQYVCLANAVMPDGNEGVAQEYEDCESLEGEKEPESD